MYSIVIYTSRYGNTRQLAEAITAVLQTSGSAQIFSADEAPESLPEPIDLVIIGGPTEAHGMTEALKRYFDRIGPGALHNKTAAVFDTRLSWPHWLAGSAGTEIAKKLDILGAWVITPPESFLVSGGPRDGNTPKLRFGELARATEWALSLAGIMGASEPATSVLAR